MLYGHAVSEEHGLVATKRRYGQSAHQSCSQRGMCNHMHMLQFGNGLSKAAESPHYVVRLRCSIKVSHPLENTRSNPILAPAFQPTSHRTTLASPARHLHRKQQCRCTGFTASRGCSRPRTRRCAVCSVQSCSKSILPASRACRSGEMRCK